MEYCLVLCTCPEGDVAKSLAETLVGEQLAACVNILPAVQSVYAWQGQIESSAESMLFIKTERQAYPRLEARLRQLHPYELPEIIGLNLELGLPDYLQWISQWLNTPSHP